MQLRRTPLYEKHKALGGRMVPFAGWEMPVQYASILEEHEAVRNRAGLFDVSHMGEISVRGPGALSLLESLTCNHIAPMSPGRVQYNAVLNQGGGLVDDITVYRVSEDDFFVVSNASNYEAVFRHIQSHAGEDTTVENQSDRWHQIAIQGPAAESIFIAATGLNPSDIAYYHFKDMQYAGKSVRISRTGYTGEDGFEIYSDIPTGLAMWELLLKTGSSAGLIPAGLGSRDILRLEAGYPLYGHELNSERSPVESGIGWIVKEKRSPYLGYDRIMKHKHDGVTHRVMGFTLVEPGVPREHYPIFDARGQTKIGEVLSGGFSPVLKKGIGTAFLPVDYFEESDPINVEIRGKMVRAEVHKGPFVKGSAGKKK